ncbi:LuxR C-terminal-related transcriptional regulator [Actinomycetes bacterium KLBMP 9759]
MLVGRVDEQAAIEDVLTAAETGRSRALVVRGEAGIGKSALLDHATTSWRHRVLRSVGIESDAELAFGALHMMLHPYLDRLDAIPGPQADALRAALGLVGTPTPSRLLVGAATLSLLAELAAEMPTLCLVDDAQWLDQGSSDALLFAARRFRADPVAMLFGVRETAVPFRTPGLDTLQLGGLSDVGARTLLDEHAPGLTEPVRRRVLDEARGNPLAVIEFGGARLVAQQAGQADPVEQVGPLPVIRRVQEGFRAQIAELPAATRTLLLAAAADGSAGLGVVLRVASVSGSSAADLEPAERVGLVTVAADAVTFRHPLIRAAAYQDAPHHQRVAVHGAFADALTGPDETDRRVWHLAAATTRPDDAVAAELERSAVRAQHRGGTMAVSAAYERAGRLSTDPVQRARRISVAAQAAWDAGKPDRAARLAAEAASLTDDPVITADALFVQAQIEYDRTSPVSDAAMAMDAAELVLERDPERAVVMLTEVVNAARHGCALDHLRRATGHLAALDLPAGSPLHLTIAAEVGWAELLDGRPELGVEPMRRLIDTARTGPVDYHAWVVAGISGLMLGDSEAATSAMTAMLADARAAGAVGWMPYTLEFLAIGQLLGGEFRAAEASATEGIDLAEEAGWHTEKVALQAVAVWLAAVAGDEARCRALAATVIVEGAARRLANTSLAQWGLALLDLAAGRFAAAADALDEVCSGPARHDYLIHAVPDHVEAAVRAGRPDRARDHLRAFEHWAAQVGSRGAAALVHRCRAVLDDDDAGSHYEQALRLHPGPFDTARTHLLHGEWLRRRRRRTEAKAQLLAALTGFDRVGARCWADRTANELAAIGERPVARPQADDLLARLTPQETQAVRLAAAGLSNKEIAAQLFLSPRTVGHHLYRAYPKLGVTRRAELAQLDLG